jgi:SAM-dependent methyltransferase
MEGFIILSKYLPKCKQWSGYGSPERKFLDAGCGIGNILVLALYSELCNRVYGLEYFPKTLAAAEKFLEPHRGLGYSIKVRKADITTYKSYGNYDVIYYYCPLSNHDKEVAFEESVEDQMKIGAVLLPYSKGSKRINKDPRFERVDIGSKLKRPLHSAFIKVRG